MSNPAPRPVQLFATCLVENLRPGVGLATVELLERYGCAVSCPRGQTCCGQPAYNAGCVEDAREMARATIAVLERWPEPVVIPSGSCADMIVHRYVEILKDDKEWHARALDVASRTYELSQFMVRVLKAEQIPSPKAGPVAYHASCHLLRGLGESDAPRRLLAQRLGESLVPLQGSEECCGFGGLFAIKMSDISGAMLKRKLDHLKTSGARTVVACDTGCLLHLEGGLRREGSGRRALHLAEVLVDEG